MVKVMKVLCAVLAAAVLAGCAENSTRLTSVWSAPDVKGPLHFNKVLVLAVSNNPDLRREVEGHVSVLMKRANGVPAYMAIPDSAYGEPGKLKAILQENNFDGVITMRLVGTSVQTSWVPAYYPDFYGYYSWAYPTVMAPAYLRVDTKIKLETKIYSLEKETLLWAGLSSTFDVTDSQQIIADLATAVVQDLQARGLVEK